VRPKTLELRIEVEGDPELELWAARRKGDLLESLTDLRLRLAVDAVTRVRAAGALPGYATTARKPVKRPHLKAVPMATKPPLNSKPTGQRAKAKAHARSRALKLIAG
jgi:hypothetical protein